MAGGPAREPPRPPVLDLHGMEHWSRTPKPCRYCGRDTNLRDSKRKPAHKTCAEQAIAQQAADAADAYKNGQL